MVMESGVHLKPGQKVWKQGQEERRTRKRSRREVDGERRQGTGGPRGWFENVIFLLAAE